jgi:hypothetical protein
VDARAPDTPYIWCVGVQSIRVAATVLLVTTYAVLLVPGVAHLRDPVLEPA